MSEQIIEIGEIGNYYGGLNAKKEGDKFFWAVENYDGYCWEEISESLYLELIKHNEK
jgi:hypothetical protein